MIAAVDVAYHGGGATAACVLFRSWSDGESAVEYLQEFGKVEEYRPGEFYLRELPPLLALLGKVAEPLEVVIVDGYVWLGGGKPGLGAHLFEELRGSVTVIGVAKSSFAGSREAIPLLRGASRRPLYVTAAGIDAATAAQHILAMHGPHRIPTLLKRADRLCRTHR